MEKHLESKIELATEEDLDSILDLMKICMPHLSRTKEALLWQYFRTPFGNAKLYCIKNSRRVVGLYSTVALQIRINDEVRKARMQLDVMTHPDFRGKGYHGLLMEKTRSESQKDGEVAYGFPNEQAIGGFRRNGKYSCLCRIPLRKKQINHHATLNQQIRISKLETGFGEFATRAWAQTLFPVSINRDATYLNWRYSKPGQKYELFELGNEEGALVLKLFSNETDRFLHICDLFVTPAFEPKLREVLNFCEAFGARNGAKTLTAWLPEGHSYSKVFEEFGLPLQGIERYMFVGMGNTPQERIYKESSWHLSQGDSDIY
jgi:GNAT superfamily N-acetyltransferase